MATKLKVNYEFVGDSTTPVTRTNSIKHGDKMLNTIINSMEKSCVYLSNFKTESNTWNDAFDLAFQALPQYGGTIKITETITITRSIDLYSLCKTYGTKKVLIKGCYSNLNNPSTNYNAIIIKRGDFDGVILYHGSSMEDIGVGRDTSVPDTHDGIWVCGITCTMRNVGVSDMGGNGIRIGNKTVLQERVSCNLGSFYSVRTVHNAGYGIKISDELSTGINTSDANGIAFYSADVRDNDLGGIYLEKCIDNYFYSPTIEVNRGHAGITMGNECGGTYVFAPYIENNTTWDISFANGSLNNCVFGARVGSNNTEYEDLGIGNICLCRYGERYAGLYSQKNISFGEIRLGGPSTNEYYHFNVNDNSLSFTGSNGNSKVIISDYENKSLIKAGWLCLSGKDAIEGIIRRPQSATSAVTIPANSTDWAWVASTENIRLQDNIIANPYTALPSGISYYAVCTADESIKIYFVNSTSEAITVPMTYWRILAISGRTFL